MGEADRGQRGKQADWRLARILVPYALRHQVLLFLAMGLLIPLAIAEAVQPILIGQVVSLVVSFLRGETTNEILWFLQNQSLGRGIQIIVILLALTITIKLTLTGIQGYQVQKVGQHITADIRDDLFDHVTSLSSRFFDRTPVGRLITRLTSDVEALGDVFSTGAIGIVGDMFSMLVIVAAMFLRNWQLASLLLLMLLPVTVLVVYFQQQYRKANYRAREELSTLNSSLQENIVGVGVVQLFRRERFNSEMYRSINQRYVQQVDRTIFFDSAVSATLEWISLVAIAGVLWQGGLLVNQGVIELGQLTTFVLFAQRLFDPLRQFAEKFTAIQAGLTSLERVSDLLAEPVEIRDKVISQHTSPQRSASLVLPNSPAAGRIQFDHVWFGYKDDDFVLRDLTFTIEPGEKVALVGPTGAGKSSIIRILSRLYEISQGRILLDGVDIRDLPQSELRRWMSIILQDGFLFAGDIKRNISLGESYSFEDIKRAAEATNVARFIEQLPDGYDTLLRQRGTNLSGGQKQLLAFARAAVRNPPLLVLDEATANLDVVTEAMIQEAMEKLLAGRTAIIIAHRLSTIRNVDRILVLKQGQLVEVGSHNELLRQDGLYASLYKLQMLEG
ncbi:MAG: ABC transporter ATP-binding protein [Cyanothece sp. SIO2G6]|nr:ABC transporter ATP-binding protein [Cyanothece sp. SIO2G6]